MNLHEFSSFFEMFSVLNLGFAGSQRFRVGVDNALSLNKSLIAENKVSKVLSNLEKHQKKLNVTLQSAGIPYQKMHKTLTKVSDRIVHTIVLIKDIPTREEARRGFTEGFKTMFLLSGLYSLFVLILEGYAQFYEYKPYHYVNTCFTLVSFLIIFNIVFFIRSFFKNFDKEWGLGYSVLIVLLFVIAGVLITALFPSVNNQIAKYEERTLITWAVAMAISPYIIHIFRAIAHHLRYVSLFYIVELRMWICDTIRKISEKKLTEWLSGPDEDSSFNRMIRDKKLKILKLFI
jgi:hypothetical protein